MTYVVRPLGGHNLGRTIEGRLCAPDEEFCDDACVKHLVSWVGKYPARAACLTNDQRHRIIDTCERMRDRVASKAEIEAQVALLDDPCAGSYEQECKEGIAEWARTNPADAACLGPADQQRMMTMCLDWKRGKRSPESITTELAAMVAAGCPVIPEPPPAPPPPPPEPPPAPPPPIVEQPPPLPIVADEPVYTVPPGPLQMETRGGFRKWGPIVGVLLVVGGGIYLLR